MTRSPGGAPEPDSGTDNVPALVSSPKELPKLPFAVGANVTVTFTEAPEAKVDPTAGAPEILKGANGASTALIVSEAPPAFEN